MVVFPQVTKIVTGAKDLNLEIIKRYGGSPGLRDIGLLESAITRVETAIHYGGNTNIFDLAAALSYGVTKNHPFLDGNKRTAFALTFCFLGANNKYLHTSNEEVVNSMVKLASSKISEAEFSKWLERNCTEAVFPDSEYAVDLLFTKYHIALKELFSK